MTLSRAGSRSQSEPSTESLADALTALCAEVGIPFEEMLHTVESALAVAYIRAFNPPGDVRVTLDTTTGALEVTSRAVRPDGTEVVRTLPSEDFKRMAAQTAKHAVLRHIHDLERDKVLRDVAEHRGELATGIVDRSENGTVYVDLGRAEGVMPPLLKEAGRFWCDLPQIAWQLAPLINLLAKFIYDRRRIVLLLFCRKPFPFIEDNLLLSG